jgi:gamma-glutamyl-gamma-aminobutyrate hydrolase PuuD
MPKVYISEPGEQYIRMFQNNGWEVTGELKEADLVQFTGGCDVDPSLYGEAVHPQTMCNYKRDQRDMAVFTHAKLLEIPMAGICRGGQFLNVASGGNLWQHVNNHAVRDGHGVMDCDTGKVRLCSSTHHQMMRPGKGGKVLGVASLSSFKENMNIEGEIHRHIIELDEEDTEVVYYQHTNCLCFQPHPEFFTPQHECQQWYFELIRLYLNLEVKNDRNITTA